MNGMETNGREDVKRKADIFMEADTDSQTNDALEVESCEDPISGLNESVEENKHAYDMVAADSMPELLCTEFDHTDLEKTPKKPDKLLPCPRCNSLNTKFCYYNNHNANQPRHFCRSCQRYWTAGGTMRNIPVGAGKRKNKHSTSHYRHLISSSGKSSSQLHVPNQGHHFHDELSSSAKVTEANDISLRFGSERPLHESDSYACNVEEKKMSAEMNPPVAEENVEESASASSLSASYCEQNHLSGNATQADGNNMNVFHNSVPPFIPFHYGAAPPWSYVCNPGWNMTATTPSNQCDSMMGTGQENNSPSHIPWNPYFTMPRPAFCATTIPFPFVPPPFWGCMAGWPNGTWGLPWSGYNIGISPSSSVNNGCSYDNPHALGKHSRDVTLKAEEDKEERSLWIPKTLRIDDPNEAAKSSIWKTLGIQPKGGIFSVSQAENEDRDHVSYPSEVFHANPAAMSRSQAFRECA